MTREDDERSKLQRKTIKATLNKYLKDCQCKELDLRDLDNQKKKSKKLIDLEALF